MIPEVSLSTSRCPYPQRWACYDGMATEVEVLNMLTALIRMLKPEVIVETGCYLGLGTERLVKGIDHNGFGRVYTCDIDHTMEVRTKERLFWVPGDRLTVWQCTGKELIERVPAPIDFAFLDSGGQTSVRREELEAVLPKLSPWGVIVVHDTGETHPDFREEFETAVRDLGLDRVFFDTPRGLAIIKKRV